MAYFGYVERKHTQNSPLVGKTDALWELYNQDFFLLPGTNGDQLGVPVNEELKRNKRDLIEGFQKWGDEEWAPELILEMYGPATWTQDGSWGYQTPNCMLNRIRRLQAVVEIITELVGQWN